MRLVSFVLAWLATSWVTSTATADVAFTATASAPRPLDALEIGDEVTIDIRISSTGSPGVYGVGAAVFGYEPDIVDFVSGQAVEGFFYEVCLPGFGCFNALEQSSTGPREGFPGVLIEQVYPNSGPYVQIAYALSFAARIGTGTMDPGLDGIVSGGDAQFRVRFRTMGLGTTTLEIGTDLSDPYIGNAIIYAHGVTVDATNAFITIQVVPEPGPSLLLGLGLAGLAASGRRGPLPQRSARA